MNAPTNVRLSLLETRVLGVLVEKEKTVPDSYPLSLNALVLGCNQRNNRDPVLSATESEVQAAVDALRGGDWVIESSGARVARYSHNVGRVLRIPEQSVALLAALMLRGAQTTGELRIATERLHRFADLSSVETFLEELAQRPPERGGPLVVQLPRQPGAREPRWAHLLCGPVDVSQAIAPAASATRPEAADIPLSELAALKAQNAQLSAELATLRAHVERLARELGMEL